MVLSWLSEQPILSKLIVPKRRANGRSFGKVVVRHRGGGKNKTRHLVDFNRIVWSVPGTVIGFERCRSSAPYLVLISYPIGILSYILMPYGLKLGDTIEAGWAAVPKIGNCLPLFNIPLNIKIHAIESFPGSGAVYARAAGNWALIVSKSVSHATILLKNGKQKKIHLHCFATIGRVSNLHHQRKKFKKAGDQRNRGVRPSVRGVAMNPVDHPHGGGKGKKSKNAVPEAPWGRLGARKKIKKNDF